MHYLLFIIYYLLLLKTIFIFYISVEVGIEPTTFRLTAWRSNQLSYTTILLFSLVSTSALPTELQGQAPGWDRSTDLWFIFKFKLESVCWKKIWLTREGIEPPTYDLGIIALQLSYLVIVFAIFIWVFVLDKKSGFAVWKYC